MEDVDLETIEEDLKRFQEDEVVRDALGQGVDLREYARQLDAELSGLQSSSVPEFVEEAPVSAELFEELQSCDEILGSMERILQGFQADLGGISDEIRHLQEQSLSMNVKVKNRKMVEEELFSVLEKMVVSDKLVAGICQAPVNEEYLALVKELDVKVKFARSKEVIGASEVAPNEIMAMQEVEPQLEKLRLKAVAKVRAFLLHHFAELKKPRTNVQILQENVLRKYKYFVQFLADHAPAVVEEVKGTYVETMSKILYTLFKSYYASLIKLQQAGPGKEDVIAVEEATLGSVTQNASSLFGAPGSSAAEKLAKREAALGEPDAPPIIVHIAKSANTKFYFESIFRSVQKHLMDSATSEFIFILDFFHVKNNDLFNQIFARTLSLCLENIENFLYNCNDVVALLLMIRTMQAHRLIMERRKVPCLDGYFDHVNMLLWPSFKKALNAQMKSLQPPDYTKFGALRLDLKPHYVSLRYADFATIVHALSTSLSTTDDMLLNDLSRLRMTYQAFLEQLLRAALTNKHHHRALETAKGKLIFRINNFDAVLSHLTDAAYGEDITSFQELVDHDIAMYIEEELSQSLGPVSDFLKHVDEQEGPPDLSQLAPILQDFGASWKSTLELLNSSVTNYFTSPENAREILKQTLTQFLLYYTRFQDFVKTHGDPKLHSRLVTIQEIMNEMKKYSRGQF